MRFTSFQFGRYHGNSVVVELRKISGLDHKVMALAHVQAHTWRVFTVLLTSTTRTMTTYLTLRKGQHLNFTSLLDTLPSFYLFINDLTEWIDRSPNSMSTKKCCLRQHVRSGPTNPTFIDLSLDDTVLKYLLCGPNLLECHVEEDFQLFHIDETWPESGSLAILR